MSHMILDAHFCKLSDEAMCMSESSVSYLKGMIRGKIPAATSAGRKASLERLKNVSYVKGIIEGNERFLSCVYLKNKGYYSDLSTGTLYDESGKCATSEVRVLRDQEPASKKQAKEWLNSLAYDYDIEVIS